MASQRNEALPLLLSFVLAAMMVGVDHSDALQLHDVPTSFPSSVASQKLIITVRDRSIASRSDAEEVMKLPRESRSQAMTSAEGHKYACKIPLRTRSQAEEQAEEASELAAGVPEQGAGGAEAKSPVELLDQLSALCLYRQEGMWTYEMCYKKHTRQFRQAMQRIISGAQAEALSAEDFSCGRYAAATVQDFSVKYDFSATGIPMTYISHNLTDGAPCVMTGASRTSEVRFTCMPHAKDNLLVLVKEFPTCNYIYVVATPFLCSHPQFQPRPQRTHTIRCMRDVEEAAAVPEPASIFSPVLSPPPPAAVSVAAQPQQEQCQEGQDVAGSCASKLSSEEDAAAEQASSNTLQEDAEDRADESGGLDSYEL